MDDRAAKRLLFIAPIVPSDRGNGLAMRCGFLLDAYARSFQVDLAVVPLAARDAELSDFARGRAKRAEVFDVSVPDSHFGLLARLKDSQARLEAFERYGRPALMSRVTEGLRAALADWRGTESYQFVHVSRLYLAELAEPFLAAGEDRPRCIIDCDEDDAAAYRRIAHMYQRAGDTEAAAWARAEARAFARIAAAWLPRFDHVLAAAADESRSLSRRAGQIPVTTIPNTVALAPLALRSARRRTRTLIFVGNMSYSPNVDAIEWFAAHVWPRLRRAVRFPLRLMIVGGDPPPSIARLDRRGGIRVTGAVGELAPYYAAADLAIVPVRAGGGTRIKLLEAAERGVPLVSTAFGAAGTRLRNRRELMIADDAASFVRACAALLARPRHAAATAARARRRVRLDYDARFWGTRLVALIGADDWSADGR